jgi:hypothetical protein
MNCMVFDGVGSKGAWLSVGAPSMHSMSGLSLARHVHGVMGHVQLEKPLWDCVVLWSRVLVTRIYECIASHVFS